MAKINNGWQRFLTTAFFSVFGLAVVLSAGFFYFRQSKPMAILAGQKINLELVRTDAEMVQGLSGRKSLAPDAGMLFILRDESVPGFWMKDMNFPLDIIFIKGEEVAGYVENAPVIESEQERMIYRPAVAINYVLEVNAGFVSENGVKKGDKVTFVNVGF